jgi:hypothetical protein
MAWRRVSSSQRRIGSPRRSRRISQKGGPHYLDACRERAGDFCEETFVRLIKDEIFEVINGA